MKIIILGAGQVGGTLAENLVGENNDITVVDSDPSRLRVLQDKFDLRVVHGHGSHPRILREAGAEVRQESREAGQNIKEGASDATAATGRAVERAGEKIQDASK